MKKKDLRVIAAIIGMAGLLASCEYNSNGLGADILPPGDSVGVKLDTIFDLDAYAVTGKRVLTSETSVSSTTMMLLGELEDTIVGSSRASVITQFDAAGAYVEGPNTVIDTLMLSIYVNDFLGDTEQEITLNVYEFNERIYRDSLYYSNYEPEGKYNPLPLAVKSIVPENGTTYEILIEDQDFLDKFLAIQNDTTYYYSDSAFKDYFNGLYITAESSSPEGAIARIMLSSPLSSLIMKYANDSTEVDSTAGRDYVWATYSINEYYTQKVNIFEHDYSGTALGDIIDDEAATSPYSYVQGMGGVNTRFSFSRLEEWMDQNPIIINSARLVFDVVPEQESGILIDDLPDRLMMGTILEDNSYEQIYDYNILSSNDLGANFGGYLKGQSLGLFNDTTYIYRFNIGLHFQALLDGTKAENDFILQVSDGLINPKITKLWSNLPANERRIRLEVVYLKL
jgi:hypothetical protein